MLEAILFDHDGTLVDSEKVHFKLLSEVVRKYGICLTYEEYRENYEGIPLPATATKLVSHYDLDIAPDVIVSQKKQATTHYLSEQAFPLMSGAKDAITYFHSLGLRLAVVTGAARDEGVYNTLKNHSLDKYISVVVSADDVERSKPAPDCYSLAMNKLNVSAENCVAIEDTLNGSLSAVAAGIACIGVSSAITQSEPFQGNVVAQFTNLEDARSWLQRNHLSSKRSDG